MTQYKNLVSLAVSTCSITVLSTQNSSLNSLTLGRNRGGELDQWHSVAVNLLMRRIRAEIELKYNTPPIACSFDVTAGGSVLRWRWGGTKKGGEPLCSGWRVVGDKRTHRMQLLRLVKPDSVEIEKRQWKYVGRRMKTRSREGRAEWWENHSFGSKRQEKKQHCRQKLQSYFFFFFLSLNHCWDLTFPILYVVEIKFTAVHQLSS